MFESMFFELYRYGLVFIYGLCIVAMIASNDISQETLAIDMLTAIKSSLSQIRKQALRLLRLYVCSPFK